MTSAIVKYWFRNALILTYLACAEGTTTKYAGHDQMIRVNKCCEKFEILLDLSCSNANDSRTALWTPSFTSYDGYKKNVGVKYKFVIGIPACGSMQSWSIYHYNESPDQLVLMDDGKLRHYTKTFHDSETNNLNSEEEPLFYDYNPGQYCLEKAVTENGSKKQSLFAMICLPEKTVPWTDIDFILRKILNPILHGVAMGILLAVAVIYFILPTLRDLVGNIITTITICLVVSEASNLVRIFTEFSNHVSFLIADTILYISLLGAFFWLNSLGYYIWKTFRARNVFLRVTDGRKYCWYSGFVWGSTGIMASLAIFSHYFLDSSLYRRQNIIEEQETIGWLGIAIFFSPIAITILVDVFFYATTMKHLNRRYVFGRIQHKLKANFIMYSLLCLVMTTSWIFLVFSWLNYNGIFYAQMVVHAMQAPLILYICVFRQKHVTFLLKKSCCLNEPPSVRDWGDELNYIGGNEF